MVELERRIESLESKLDWTRWVLLWNFLWIGAGLIVLSHQVKARVERLEQRAGIESAVSKVE